MSDAARTAIQLGLPHRPPFLFVHEVVRIEPGISAECRMRLAVDDPMFAGHFPNNALVPGVILTEALAQTAGLAGAAGETGTGPQFLLTAIRSMKFFFPVRPGMPVELKATLIGKVGDLWSFDVTAEVGGKCAAAGTLVLSASASAGIL